MPTYKVTGINVASFPLGEADKVLTIFSAERGLVRAVAKGSRKPGSKMTGRADVLNVNQLLIATGKSLDIITQAETLETFQPLRGDLVRLSYCLYYAELTHSFGQGLAEESASFFEFLVDSIHLQSEAKLDAARLCMEFELQTLDLLGYKPELTVCVSCRTVLSEYNLAGFHNELGGVVCERCHITSKRLLVAERDQLDEDFGEYHFAPVKLDKHVTPFVWKLLVLCAAGTGSLSESTTPSIERASVAARKLLQSYVEYRAGRRMRSLELIEHLDEPYASTQMGTH